MLTKWKHKGMQSANFISSFQIELCAHLTSLGLQNVSLQLTWEGKTKQKHFFMKITNCISTAISSRIRYCIFLP
uniref:Uncharacterized protein n=1 Tax=Setaria italica TaxID=4555 RepID=K3ZMG5_SETIT